MAKLVTGTFQYPANQKLNVSFKNKGIIKEFSMVGRLNTLHSNSIAQSSIDIVDLMSALPGSANKLLQEIKSYMDYKTNVAQLPKPKTTREQKNRSYAARKLKALHAIAKAGQRSFIVSPYLIVPPADWQEKVIAEWDRLS